MEQSKVDHTLENLTPFIDTLEVCELCGAFNSLDNKECFCCRWHGRFDRRPEAIRLLLYVLEHKYGAESAEVWLRNKVEDQPRKTFSSSRVRDAIQRLYSWFFGEE